MRTAVGNEGRNCCEEDRRRIDAENLYVRHYGLLRYVACRKFGVPGDHAEGLIQDVMIAWITSAGEIRSVKAWLVAAMCNMSRAYWRSRARKETVEGGPFPDAGRDDPSLERVEREILLAQVLQTLALRDRQILGWYYLEQVPSAEIARRLGTTKGYAEKLVWRALRRARTAMDAPAACGRTRLV
jgi:RNA polymerase sigma factor (sigma-70 family)